MPVVAPVTVAMKREPDVPTLTPPLPATASTPTPAVPWMVSAEWVSETLTEPVPTLVALMPVAPLTLPLAVTLTAAEPPVMLAVTPAPVPPVMTPLVETVTAPAVELALTPATDPVTAAVVTLTSPEPEVVASIPSPAVP